MATEFLMPKSGMGVTEATITKWHKAEGDSFAEGDVLLEIETAKAVEEVEAPFAGSVEKLLKPEGELVEVQAPIALLVESG